MKPITVSLARCYAGNRNKSLELLEKSREGTVVCAYYPSGICAWRAVVNQSPG